MQLDLEFLPVLMGMATFIFYRRSLVLQLSRPRRKLSDARKATAEAKLAGDTAGAWEEEDVPQSPVQREPDSEPELEPEALSADAAPPSAIAAAAARDPQAPPLVRPPTAQTSRARWTAICALALLPAALELAARGGRGLRGFSGPAVAPAFQTPEAAALAEAKSRIVELEQLAAPAAQALAATTSSSLAAVAVPDSLMDFSEPALTIKLTRQSMNMYEDDEFVKSAYFGTLMVGTPPEPFTVVFDTGSGHLVLPSTYCSSDTCKAHKRFRRSASSSALDINYDGTPVPKGALRDQISVSFGTGEVTGVFVEDVICIDGGDSDNAGDGTRALDGPANSTIYGSDALPLQQGCVTLRMIAATELSEDPFKTFEFDGILGLGLDGLSQTPAFNFLGVVAKSIEAWGGRMPHTFGVFLANHEAEDSEISLGGWARNHLVEDLSWSPVPDPELGHWVIDIKGIRIDDKPLKFCEQGCKAAVDTGTSLLAVPTDVFPELYGALKHPAPPAGHCQGSGPMLHFEFESFTVTLGPQDYAKAEPAKVSKKPRFGARRDAYIQTFGGKPVRRDMKCLPILMTLDLPEPLGPKLFILGEPVLRKYYTVYDRHAKRVGFGRARHDRVTSREDYFMDAGSKPKTKRKSPTMFDIFRWRKSSAFTYGSDEHFQK